MSRAGEGREMGLRVNQKSESKETNKNCLNNHQVQKISMSPEMGDEAQCKKWGHRNEAGRGDRNHL